VCACARAQSRLSHVYRLEEKGVSYFQKNVLQVFRKRSITRISRKRNRDILLGTWNVRSLYRAGSLMAAARELARYKLGLVGCRR